MCYSASGNCVLARVSAQNNNHFKLNLPQRIAFPSPNKWLRPPIIRNARTFCDTWRHILFRLATSSHSQKWLSVCILISNKCSWTEEKPPKNFSHFLNDMWCFVNILQCAIVNEISTWSHPRYIKNNILHSNAALAQISAHADNTNSNICI